MAIILLATFARLLGVAARPIWYDEAFSIFISQESLGDILYATLGGESSVAADVHPVFYYALLGAWINLWGDGLISVRSYSILFGIGIVLAAYSLGSELFGQRFGLVGAFLIALAPFQVHYAQEIRMYAQMCFFIVLSALLLWLAMRSGKFWFWVLFSITAALAQYSHTLAGIYLVLLGVTPILFRRWKDLLRVILAGGFALILYIPWLSKLVPQIGFVGSSYWISKPGFSRLITTLLSFVTNLPLSGIWLVVGLFVTLACSFLGLWQTFRWLYAIYKESRADTTKNQRLDTKFQGQGLWFGYMAIGPPILLFVISQWKPVFIERSLLPAGVFFLLWLAWAYSRIGMPKFVRITGFGLLFLGFGIGLFQHLTYDGFPYAPYSEVAKELSTLKQESGVIVHSNKLSYFPTKYYSGDILQEYIADVPGSGADTLKLPTQEVLGSIAVPTIDQAVGQAEEVWLIIFKQAIQEYIDMGFDKHPQQTWLEEHFQVYEVLRFSDLLLIKYSNEP